MKKAPVDTRLKEFFEANFDFDALKEVRFWPKGTRRTDYAAQAARICHYFGYETVYEYEAPEIIEVPGGAIVQSPGSINASGEYEDGIRG